MTDILHKELSFEIFGAAMEVHKVLGGGFLEAVYHKALAYELTLRGIPYTQQTCLSVIYKGVIVGEYVADFIVDGKIVVELKAVSHFSNEHRAQALNYLAATGYRLAILLNFSGSKVTQMRIAK